MHVQKIRTRHVSDKPCSHSFGRIFDIFLSDQQSWPEDSVFEKESFELLEHILMEAGELESMLPYEALVNTKFAEEAAKKQDIM